MFFVPSEKAIRAAFSHDLDSRLLRAFRSAAKAGKRHIAQGYADALLEGYGVESIRCPNRGLLAVHVNTGDTYSATLLCNIETGAWRITTWGDYVEQFEKRYGRKATESLCAY